MTRLVTVLVFVLAAIAADPFAAHAQGVPRFQCSGVTSPVAVVNFNCGGCSVSGNTMTVPCGSGGGSGTVTSIACGSGLTCAPAPITTTGTISLTSSSTTVNGQTCSLGSSCTVPAVTSLSQGTGITLTPNPTTTTGTVAVNQSFSPTWTGNHTWSPGGTPLIDFGVTVPTYVVAAANTSFAALPGTGNLVYGNMTGATSMPTGNFTWNGAAGASFEMAASSTGGRVQITSGIDSTWRVANGKLTLDASTTLEVGPSFATAVVTARAGIRNSQLGMINQTVGAVLSVVANAITPTTNLHHVGGGLIKTITVPATLTAGATLQVIPDAVYTYDATGNIVVPSGGGTAVVNKLMTFVWDGSKWTPSY